MAKYIKSHSNFVLKEKHQDVSNGTIYERDAVTIGGVDKFSKGETPLFKSGNFLITVNNGIEPTRDISLDEWEGGGEFLTLSALTSSDTVENTLEIVNKPDFYSLKDFAYYGSCSELFRASINDIITRFPGEMYMHYYPNVDKITSAISGNNIEIVKSQNEKGIDFYYNNNGKDEKLDSTINGNTCFLLENPFNIDIFSTNVEVTDKNKLKYFANEGYKNYEIILDDNTVSGITSWTVNTLDGHNVHNAGDKIAEVTLNEKYNINVHLATCKDVVYMTILDFKGCSIRPKREFYDQFFNTLDDFQKILLNRDSQPIYKAKFEIETETAFGSKTELTNFIFPLGHGGYNLAIDDGAFKNYIDRLVKIGEDYDEKFSDNLYRSMTHEAIKNFDWTFTREFEKGEEDEYVIGGSKIEKLIRLYGREFDEIKRAIEGIKNYNILSYNGRNNVPDYFLTDKLNFDGWVVTNVYPKLLSMSGETIEEIQCVFTDIISEFISPYSCFDNKYYATSGLLTNDDGYNGYYHSGNTQTSIPYSSTTTYFGSCASEKIKAYTSEKEYSMNEVNNHFMRMLALSSRSILNKKGTIESIEEVLSLFGLKSKRWYNSLNDIVKKQYSACCDNYDYSIEETTCMTPPIIDYYQEDRDMYYIDWLNYAKKYVYNTEDFLNGVYNSYRGLPVSYEDVSVDDKKYRLLYPYFDKNNEYDGAMYYQMNGGWQNRFPYSFNKKNQIVTSDKNRLFHETLRPFKTVENLEKLLTLTKDDVYEGVIYKVDDISTEYIIIGEKIYEILTEIYNGVEYKFIEVIYNGNGVIELGGDNTLFGEIKYTYINDSDAILNVDSLYDGYHIKFYFSGENLTITNNGLVLSTETNDDVVTIAKGVYSDGTNYFMLNNVEKWNELSENGWAQLQFDDEEYKRVLNILDYYEGNNPHSANEPYDEGQEYINHFYSLFKELVKDESNGENVIDSSCLEDGGVDYYTAMDEYSNIGFHLIDLNHTDSECYTTYLDNSISSDTKIHFFGESVASGDTIQCSLLNNATYSSKTEDFSDSSLNIMSSVITENHYDGFGGRWEVSGGCTDNTDQIVNTKVVNIIFNLKSESGMASSDTVEEIKYYESVIVPYLEQVIPSNTILKISYINDSIIEENKPSTEFDEAEISENLKYSR